jgi:hypothetical protein
MAPIGINEFRATFKHLTPVVWRTELPDTPVAHEFAFQFGLATFTSVPAGATVSLGEAVLGKTPINEIPLRLGEHQVKFDLGGTTETKTLRLSESDRKIQALNVDFAKAMPPRPPVFTNEHGIEFVPVGNPGFAVSRTEITEQQFFVQMPNVDRTPWKDVSDFPRSNVAIVSIEPKEAQEFCNRLQKTSAGGRYRLPTVREYALLHGSATNGIASVGNKPAEFCVDTNGAVLAARRTLNVKTQPGERTSFNSFRVILEDPPTKQ